MVFSYDRDGELVFRADSTAQFVTARSVLEDAGIPFVARNALLQNLFGAGQFGLGYNLAVGEPELRVSPQDAQAARELLELCFDDDLNAGT